MKLLTSEVAYETTIPLAPTSGSYATPVLFHCYWNGILNEKHYVSIKSCYAFNVKDRPLNNIILWLENNTPNEWTLKISKYAEIRQFTLNEEKKDTFLSDTTLRYNSMLSFYSDVVRYVLLYKYGGCWFDLDCFMLRSLDPLFYHYGVCSICVYQWEHEQFPNGAIYICLQPKSESMKQIIEFIIQRNRGWGFCEATITYDLPLNLYVLPCSWFDPSWIKNPHNLSCDDLFKATTKTYTFDSFFKGAFCYHWHNRWDHTIAPSSIFKQLESLLDV
jgi:mannosyltransferase OCH1-like enzyme